MKKRLGVLALECFLDLGVTLIYAVIAGFLIVGIVASDEAPVSILSASLYAAALPGAALALIIVEVLLRTHRELREARHRSTSCGRSAEYGSAVRAPSGAVRSS